MTVLLFMLSTSVFAHAAGTSEDTATDITGSKGQVSRDEVMAGFSGSVEFDGIMKYYGL